MTDAFEVAQLVLLGEAVERLQNVAVFVWDEDRNYVAANQAACELLRKTRDEILSMKVGDLAENRASPLFDEVQHGGPIHSGVMESPAGPLNYLTCRTRVAGLPVHDVGLLAPRMTVARLRLAPVGETIPPARRTSVEDAR